MYNAPRYEFEIYFFCRRVCFFIRKLECAKLVFFGSGSLRSRFALLRRYLFCSYGKRKYTAFVPQARFCSGIVLNVQIY